MTQLFYARAGNERRLHRSHRAPPAPLSARRVNRAQMSPASEPLVLPPAAPLRARGARPGDAVAPLRRDGSLAWGCGHGADPCGWRGWPVCDAVGRPNGCAPPARGAAPRRAASSCCHCATDGPAPHVGLQLEAESLAVDELGAGGDLADAAAEVTWRLAPAEKNQRLPA